MRVPIHHGHDIHELQPSPDSESDAPKEVLPPEAQHADHRQIRRQAVNRDLHHLLGPAPQQQQPRPGDRRPDPAGCPVQRPVRLRQFRSRPWPGRRHVGEPVNVEPIGLLVAVESEEAEDEADGDEVEDEDAQPEHVPPVSRRLRRRRRRRRGRRREGVGVSLLAVGFLDRGEGGEIRVGAHGDLFLGGGFKERERDLLGGIWGFEGASQ